MRILLVSSNNALIARVENALKEEFAVDVVDSGAQGLYSAQEPFYSLVLIDFTLPDMSGSDLCSLIRQNNVYVPIMIFAESLKTPSRVSCFTRGADALVGKKFAPRALLARVRALLRRLSYSAPPGGVYKIEDVEVNFWNRRVSHVDKVIPFRKKEFDLLEFFIRNKGRVLSRDMLLEAIWEDTSVRDSNVVDSYVCILRRKLSPFIQESPIRTVYGVGYIFNDLDLQPDG
jgi:two-component system, OmpR family, copper resistance phosphate regulon response regulator CusR